MAQNQEKRYYKESLQRFFVIYAFVPILIMTIIFSLFTLVIPYLNGKAKSENANRIMGWNLQEVYAQYEVFLEEFTQSENTLNFLETQMNKNLMFKEFYRFNNQSQIKCVIHVFDAEGQLMETTQHLDGRQARQTMQAALRRVRRQPEALLHEQNAIVYSEAVKVGYTFGKAAWSEGEIKGYVLLNLLTADLLELVKDADSENAVLTDLHNNIIVSTNPVLATRHGKLLNEIQIIQKAEGTPVKLSGTTLLQNKKVFVCGTIYEKEGFILYTINTTEPQEEVYIDFFILVVVSLLVQMWIVRVLGRRISVQKTQALDELARAAQEIQKGNLDYRIHLATNDEFELLSEQYNTMAEDIKNLLNRNSELYEITKESEIKRLESQFNPHLIFNVLETLRYSMTMDTEAAQEIITTLSCVLRYSAYNSNKSVAVRDDLRYIHDFLYLYQLRFRERLSYQIDVDESIQDVLVPRLMLQPIVENSVKYGYRSKHDLNIHIRGYDAGGDIVFEVTDSGEGVDENELKAIEDLLASETFPREHTGLYNIHRRLMLLFGEEYGLRIRAEKGQYFQVVIRIQKGEDL